MNKFSYSPLIDHWSLDQNVCFLNHGSFGATPKKIIQYQHELVKELESQPVRFLVRKSEESWVHSRSRVAAFLGAKPENLVFVRNTTSGVNTVLNSLALGKNDEVIITNHTYGACENTLNQHSIEKGFLIKKVIIDYPNFSEEQFQTALKVAVTQNTKLVLIDHVTSASAIIFPIQEVVDFFESKGVEVLVDGAHSPGMIDLNLENIGASYYVGNFHKWICAPKGSAFLYVRNDKQNKIKPLIKSHAYKPNTLDDLWARGFFWQGTEDYSAYFSTPFSLDYFNSLLPDYWGKTKERNRQLLLKGKKILEDGLHSSAVLADHLLGFMANIYLGEFDFPTSNFNQPNELQNHLFNVYKIEVPIINFPIGSKKMWVRISAFLYNDISQYYYLAESLKESLDFFEKKQTHR